MHSGLLRSLCRLCAFCVMCVVCCVWLRIHDALTAVWDTMWALCVLCIMCVVFCCKRTRSVDAANLLLHS
jgi:hypothetical protein